MDQTLPRDPFDVRLRELTDNPGAVKVSARINRADFYGRSETWIVDTFRVDGQTETFIQKVTADGAMRLHLPAEVMQRIDATYGGTIAKVRRRAARQAVETKRARGIKVGNAEALRKGRRSRKGAKA